MDPIFYGALFVPTHTHIGLLIKVFKNLDLILHKEAWVLMSGNHIISSDRAVCLQ